MKTNNENSRRQFIGALALGATASTISVLANPVFAKTNDFEIKTMNDAEEWFNNVKGSHRITYDGSTPHGGLPVVWTWAFYLTNNGTGTADDDMTAVTVLRHTAIPYALEDRLWAKYKFGEFFKINDNAAGAPSLRNTVYEPIDGDFPLPGIDGMKRMQERGAMFCVCNLALKVFSQFIAQGMSLDTNEVYEDFLSGVLPGIQIVPSGVWALGRAQEHGCGYIFAGE